MQKPIWNRISTALFLLLLVGPAGTALAQPADDTTRGTGRTGVLIMAHGGKADWNQAVADLARQVDRTLPAEVAFGMATRANLQKGIDALVGRGAKEIIAVPLFISSHSSVITSTQYLLGLRAEAPPELALFAKMGHDHGAHAPGHGESAAVDPTTPVQSPAPIRMTAALDRHPLVAEILLSRARDISQDPAREVVIVVAHGPVSEEDNKKWLADMGALAEHMRPASAFHRIEYLTVRDDAPEPVRAQATAELRAVVERASGEGHKPLIVPLLISYGGIEQGIRKRLEGLNYAMSSQGLLPDERLTQWVLAVSQSTASATTTDGHGDVAARRALESSREAASTAAMSGEVVDQFSQAIVGATVVLKPEVGQARETTSDASGSFRFDELPPGTHTLTVASPGFAASTLELQLDARGETRTSVELDLVRVTSQLTVTAPSPEGYDAPRAAAATRLNIPILETPFSVQVVPSRVIKDQNALGLEEIYTNISGVSQAGNTLNAQTEVRPMIRGFEAGVPLRNGLRATTVGAVDTVNIESVEVLKGPASILYGALEPGGVLNYTTKKPLMAPRFEVSQQLGSYDHSRTTADVTGPLNHRRTTAYRLNLARQDSGSFRDFLELDRLAVAPSLTFRPDDRNELFADFSYTEQEVPYDSGVPFGLDGRPLVPDNTFFGDPDLAGRNLEDYFSSVAFFRHLTERVTARTQFQFHRVNALNESIRHRGVRGVVGAETLRRRYQNEDRTDDDYQFVGDLISTFELGATSHQTLAGLDLAYQDSEFLRFRQNLPNIPITSSPGTDFIPPANQPLQTILGSNRWAAVYFQDQISMLNDGRLKLLVGARYDTTRGEEQRDGVVQPETEADKLTGRFGAGYQVVPSMLAFGSVSQSFLPQSPGTVDATGKLLDPQTGIQYEGGFKFGLFGGRFHSTVSAYHIKKENVPLFDEPLFSETGEIVFFPGVAERSQGFELDLSGRITNSLSLIANYAYNDAETVENANDLSQIGRTLGNTPAHLSRLWLAYAVPFRTLRGLGGGVGVRAQSAQFTQFDDLRLPGFGVWDLGVWYHLPLGSDRRRLRFAVNIENLLDKQHYLRASDRSIVHPGTPRSAIGAIGFEF